MPLQPSLLDRGKGASTVLGVSPQDRPARVGGLGGSLGEAVPGAGGGCLARTGCRQSPVW